MREKKYFVEKINSLKVVLRDQRGVSVLAIIFVILVLAAVGYTFSAMMAAKQKSVPATLEAAKAFYIAEGGLHYGGKYLAGLSDWSTAASQTKDLGGGSFTVQFSNYSSGAGGESITATSTGTCGAAERVVIATFER